VVREKMRRRYRLETVARSLDGLMYTLPQAYRAIVALYVDPYDELSEPLDEWHKDRRRQWADSGIDWMVREIPGELVAFGEKRGNDKRSLIREMLEQGFTYRAITFSIGCSRRDISAVKRGMEERQERTPSAVGIAI